MRIHEKYPIFNEICPVFNEIYGTRESEVLFFMRTTPFFMKSHALVNLLHCLY